MLTRLTMLLAVLAATATAGAATTGAVTASVPEAANPAPGADVGLYSVELLDAAYRSVRSGRWESPT